MQMSSSDADAQGSDRLNRADEVEDVSFGFSLVYMFERGCCPCRIPSVMCAEYSVWPYTLESQLKFRLPAAGCNNTCIAMWFIVKPPFFFPFK